MRSHPAMGEGGENNMRRWTLRSFTLAGAVIAVASAFVLGFVGGGHAAGTAICPIDSNSVPLCLKAGVTPRMISQGAAGLGSGTFNNRSTSTAAKSALSLLFSNRDHVDPVTGENVPRPVAITYPADVTVVVNGSKKQPSCSPAPGTTFAATPSIACSLGNLGGGSNARILVRFTPSLQALARVAVNSSILYGESGKDNPGGPNGTVNDTKTTMTTDSNTLTIVSGTAITGGCFKSGTNQVGGSNGSSLAATVDVPPALDAVSGIFPCTPAAAGVTDEDGIHGKVVYVDLPPLSGAGWALFTLDVTPLPPGENTNTFVLYEALAPSFAFTTGNFITVPACVDGFPPVDAEGNSTVGVPTLVDGAWNGKYDTCQTGKKSLPAGGGEFYYHVFGNPFDGKYTP